MQCYELIHEGIHFTLVDTPGFDDSSGLDHDVVKEILSWLEVSMGTGLLLDALVYMHRIIDPRISGTARSNMRLFRELCGDESLHKVVLATTFWANVEDEIGRRREQQLLDDSRFWKPMVDKGSRSFRLQGDRKAGLEILSHIARHNGKFLVQAQEEMRSGQQAHETSAGRAMNLDLDGMKAEYEEKLAAERVKQEAVLAEVERRRREEQRKIEERRRVNIERLKRQAEKKERARQESEARQALHEKMEREAAEREIRQKIENAAQVVRAREAEAARIRQLSLYVCKNFDTKRVCCSKCHRRLDLVASGKWCYRKVTFDIRSSQSSADVLDCCHCDYDRRNHCIECGNTCPRSDLHPPMTTRAVTQTFIGTLLR